MSESPDIRRVLLGAVPPLPEPPDRLGEVRARVRRTRLRTAAVTVGTAAVVSAIGLLVPRVLAGPAPEPAAEGEHYRGTVLVFQTAGEVPRLCPVAWVQIPESLSPPADCPGPQPEVVGWDWDGLDAESVGGTVSGTYQVVGVWDGERFTVTEPPSPGDASDAEEMPAYPGTDFSSPCPEPAGGWQVDDPEKVNVQALEAAFARAAERPSYAGGWVDESALDGNYPLSVLMTLLFTEDLAGNEQRIREVWGGGLCVSRADYSEAELSAIQQSILDGPSDPNVLSANAQTRRNRVVVEALVATADLQRRLDERFGPGRVIVEGWLEPAG